MNYKELKIGDVFYEECPPFYGVLICTSDVIKTFHDDLGKNQFTWQAVDHTGKVVDFLITEGLEHYGPKVTKELTYFGLKLWTREN